jgi:hypothetical protein
MSKRACSHKTKKGQPCKATPLSDVDYCISHAPEDVRDSTGFGGSQPGSGRPPTPRAVDVLLERIEAGIDQVLNPLWDALAAEQGVVVGNGAHAEIEMVPDHKTRIAASRELLDRGYGRPKQSTEISGPDGGAITLVPPADVTEKSRKAAKLLNELGQVDEPAG